MNTVTFDGKPITPSKIICVGMNYVEHIEELGNWDPQELVFFMKPNSSISDTLRLPEEPCRYEGEISLLMMAGRAAGVGFGLDLTLSEVQKRMKAKGLPWEKCKAFNGSALFSPFVPAPALENLSLETRLNGRTVQSGGYELMIYKPETVIAEAEKWFTLNDGDIIMTGTPKGVGSFARGDDLSGRILSGDTEMISASWTVA